MFRSLIKDRTMNTPRPESLMRSIGMRALYVKPGPRSSAFRIGASPLRSRANSTSSLPWRTALPSNSLEDEFGEIRIGIRGAALPQQLDDFVPGRPGHVLIPHRERPARVAFGSIRPGALGNRGAIDAQRQDRDVVDDIVENVIADGGGRICVSAKPRRFPGLF